MTRYMVPFTGLLMSTRSHHFLTTEVVVKAKWTASSVCSTTVTYALELSTF